MKTKSLVLKAIDEPMPGVKNPGTHQRYKNPKLELLIRVLPKKVPKNHIRVKVLHVGVCGSDLHLIQSNSEGYIKSSAPASIPEWGRVLGHEGVGKIIDVGANVTDITVGDLVVFESILSCKNCPSCRKGEFNQCLNAKLLGMEMDGLFSEIADIPADLACLIESNQASEQYDSMMPLACIEPCSVSLLACMKAKITPGDNVLIFGAGPIGLYAAMLAKNVFGAHLVTVIEPTKLRRTMAKSWSHEVFDSVESYWLSKPLSADILIEASGYLTNVNDVFKNLSANARVILLARSGEPLNINSVDHLITNAITIAGVRGHLGGLFSRVLNLEKSSAITLGASITKTISSLEDLMEILSSNDHYESNQCKMVLSFSCIENN